MNWVLSHRCDPRGRVLADRHYNRQHIGAVGFVPPGRCIVLLTPNADALWVSSFPYAAYVRHDWAGAWVCTLFRNESPFLSSDLIKEALAVTRYIWGEPPPLGMITFVDADKTRKKRDPGRCYRKADFAHVGYTKTNKLVALQCLPENMPPAQPPIRQQLDLWATVA